MVNCFILSEEKTDYRHSIKILTIMKHDSWIQRISFWYDDKRIKQTTMMMDKNELEAIATAMRGK